MRFVLVSTLALTVALGATAQTTDDTKRNENVARHFFESSNRNDIEGMLSDLTGDAKNFGRPVGREGFRMVLNDIFTTFPDWHVAVVEMIAKDDSVVMRCKVSGTHRGIGKIPVNGGMLIGVAPTGKHFETDHIHWLKFRDGKIADHYATRDDISMMRQLGLIPPTAAPSNPKKGIARRDEDIAAEVFCQTREAPLLWKIDKDGTQKEIDFRKHLARMKRRRRI